MESFDGKVVLVTGGTSGIGRATSEALAREGAHVVVAARGKTRGDETVEAISGGGGRATFVQADVTNESDIERLVREALSITGRIDAAFNNVGGIRATGPISEVSEGEWYAAFDLMLKSVFLCLKHEIAHMMTGDGGAIVNNAALVGLVGVPYMAVSTAAKHGVVGITRAAALESAPMGIRVNAIAPGAVDTPDFRSTIGATPEAREQIADRFPQKRIQRPEEVAAGVVFLLSEAASAFTGTVLVADAGFTAQ